MIVKTLIRMSISIVAIIAICLIQFRKQCRQSCSFFNTYSTYCKMVNQPACTSLLCSPFPTQPINERYIKNATVFDIPVEPIYTTDEFFNSQEPVVYCKQCLSRGVLTKGMFKKRLKTLKTLYLLESNDDSPRFQLQKRFLTNYAPKFNTTYEYTLTNSMQDILSYFSENQVTQHAYTQLIEVSSIVEANNMALLSRLVGCQLEENIMLPIDDIVIQEKEWYVEDSMSLFVINNVH